MKILLDTHILLWWLSDSPKLPTRAKQLIISLPERHIHVSIASLWEIVIKQDKGKLEGDINSIFDEIKKEGFLLLPILENHICSLQGLPAHHSDPFDRILIAQAMAESFLLLTHDGQLSAYGDDWVIQV